MIDIQPPIRYDIPMKKYIYPLILLPAILAACGGKPAEPISSAGGSPTALTITSPAFEPGAAIPSKYTCHGVDTSPALEWSAPPQGTQSLALILDDPDAPMGTWVHWVVYNLPPDAGGLPEGASQAKASAFDLPAGAIQGKTSFGRRDYGGPCPPSGTHRYFFKLYALDVGIASPGLDKSSLLEAMQGHVLGTGELIGTYTKP